MSKIKTDDEYLKIFQKLEDENWISDTELFEKSYELNNQLEA